MTELTNMQRLRFGYETISMQNDIPFEWNKWFSDKFDALQEEIDSKNIELEYANSKLEYLENHISDVRGLIRNEMIRFCMWEWYKPSLDIDELKNVCSDKVSEFLKNNKPDIFKITLNNDLEQLKDCVVEFCKEFDNHKIELPSSMYDLWNELERLTDN